MTNANQSPLPLSTGVSRILRIRDVMAKSGLSRSNIYQLSTSGTFPKRIQLVEGGTSVGWLESEIEEWINKRISERDLGVNHA